jgi:hypothetical protein
MSAPLTVGMAFSSLHAAKDALVRHTVSRGESYKKHKQTAECYVVVCHAKAKGCPYCVRFTHKNVKKGGDWVVAIYTEHTCSLETHQDWRPPQSVEYLAPNHLASFNLDHTMKPSQILNTKLQSGNRISYMQSWRTLKKVEEQILGDEAESFKKIPSFLEHLSQADPQAY